MSRNRDDFSKQTIDKLAKRVGYHCSKPDCRVITVGPKQGNDDAAVLGQAAHICAASPGGPRYDPSMSAEQRKSFDNGIWLCEKCARIIDIDYKSYPVEVLKQWKADAEALQNEALLRSLTEEQYLSHLDSLKQLRYYQLPDESDVIFGVRASAKPIRNTTYLQSGLYGSMGIGTVSPLVPFNIEAARVILKPKIITNGYLYSKKSLIPLGSVQVEEYEQDSFAHYEIVSEYYRFVLISKEDKAYGFRFEFCVEEPSVLKRKQAFSDILRIAQNDSLLLKCSNEQIIDIETHLKMTDGQWHKAEERLESYIECMDRLLEIESYYGVIFSLPPKLTPEEINNLHTISDSIHQKKCITLPGMLWEDTNTEDFTIDSIIEIPFSKPISSDIEMFGFVFSPIRYYYPVGLFSYDKSRKMYVNCSDGIGIGCEFMCVKRTAPKEKG